MKYVSVGQSLVSILLSLLAYQPSTSSHPSINIMIRDDIRLQRSVVRLATGLITMLLCYRPQVNNVRVTFMG